MEYITLNNGVKMPLVGFGTWNVRRADIISDALSVGYRLIDTARMYVNEELVGQAIKESGISRDELFITTKLAGSSNSYVKASKDIDDSLNKLGLDYVDLLLVHEAYSGYEEMYKAICDAYKAGKARAIGISNFRQDRYLSFIEKAEIIPQANQMEAHVYYPQLAYKDVMMSKGTIMQSWGALAQGRSSIFNEAILVEIGHKYHKSAAQIALKYLVQNDIPVIPKSSHKERMITNMDIFDFSLDSEDMALIKKLDEGRSQVGWY